MSKELDREAFSNFVRALAFASRKHSQQRRVALYKSSQSAALLHDNEDTEVVKSYRRVRTNVRFGSKADLRARSREVRFVPRTDIHVFRTLSARCLKAFDSRRLLAFSANFGILLVVVFSVMAQL